MASLDFSFRNRKVGSVRAGARQRLGAAQAIMLFMFFFAIGIVLGISALMAWLFVWAVNVFRPGTLEFSWQLWLAFVILTSILRSIFKKGSKG